MAQVNLRIDDNLKEEGERLFKDLGMTFSVAVNMFIAQSIKHQGLPFPVTTRKYDSISLANEITLAREWNSPEEDAAWDSL